MEWFFYALISAIAFGCYYLLLKKNLAREHAFVYLAFYSFVIAMISLVFYKQVVLPTSLLQAFLLLLDGFFLACFFLFMTYAYKNLEGSEVSPLGNLSLLLTILLSVLILGETLTFLDILGIFFMIAGVYLLEIGVKIKNFGIVLKDKHRKYLIYIIIGLIFSSLTSIIEKIVLSPEVLGLPIPSTDPVSFHVITRFVIFFFFIPVAALRPNFVQGIKHGYKNVGFGVLIAAAIYTIANILYFKAMDLGKVSHVIPVAALSSLFVTIVGGTLFHEHRLKQKIIACLVIIFGVWLIVM
ncbi:MAG TPA: EamA family transporter [Candidatus Nanoarchaeia archaeon]|nr:EamA family transporter [Candidatus Nanoarchaeia archaeon]